MNKQLQHNNRKFTVEEFPIVLVSESSLNPANTGSLFRLADAFGVQKLYLPEGTNLKSNRLKRTARATLKSVQHDYFTDVFALIKKYKTLNYQINCLEITQDSQKIANLPINSESKILLVVGEESAGISEKLLQQADNCLHIKMYGQNSSMNIANATSIALYEFTKKMSLFKNNDTFTT